MNPDRIWRELADKALASQIEAAEYGVFVAMPFRNQFSYRADEVFTEVIDAAVKFANTQRPPRPFASPGRADKLAPNASEITDEIVEHIILDHFFIADLTMANHGVLVEVGVALATKDPRQLVFITQGNLQDLHFDIRNHRVIDYDRGRPKDAIARALLEGAEALESMVGARMETIRRSLSPMAVYLLNLYGKIRLQNPKSLLHAGHIAKDNNLATDGDVRLLIFNSTVQELLARGLFELDYRVADDGANPDTWGFHATELGRAFIRKTWPKSLGAVT
jgi:hypothetical protein